MEKYKNIPVIESNRLIGLLDLIKGTSLNGFAGFYWFILIRGNLGGRRDAKIRHEAKHIERMRAMGYWFYIWKYLTDKKFYRNEEKIAQAEE